MADLNDLTAFLQVVDAGGFTAAGRATGVPKSSMSVRVSRLEEELGVRLLERTTRKLGLTDAGAAFAERVRRALEEVADAESAVKELVVRPRGVLRVTAPPRFGAVGAAVADVVAAHPELRAEVFFTERVVDLIEDGFDVAVRIGPLPDSSLVARRVFEGVPRVVVAAPTYLARHKKKLRAPRDLLAHECLLFRAPGERRPWRLVSGRKRIEIDLSRAARVVANDNDALRAAALAGLGVALLPGVTDDIEQGRLVHLLSPWAAEPVPVYAVMAGGRYLSPRARVFVDAIATRLACGIARAPSGR
jgi:DNA-binding transcriptional LysR family regulator